MRGRVELASAAVSRAIFRPHRWSIFDKVLSLHNTKREDITFIAFQLWVLGMSIAAVSVALQKCEETCPS